MSSTSKEEGGTPFFCFPIFRRLRRQKAQPQESISLDKRDTVKALEDELAEQKAKVTKLEADLSGEKRERQDEVRQLKGLGEAREKDVARKDTDIQQLEKERDTLRGKLTELKAVNALAKDLSARLATTEKLLNERTTELSAAQVFLTKVDAVSEAEVVGMIDNLNTLICSVSGALSDTWDQREPIPGTFPDESDMEQIRNRFGNLITEQIAARNSVAVNLTVQMRLGLFIEQIASGWGGGPAERDLADIYAMISTKESQTVASRWRTLTKRYTPNQEPPKSEDIIDDLARILMVTQSFADLSDALESVEESAGAEIKAIIEATVQLDETIKTKVASSDMYVYVLLPGTPFSEETMEDEFGDEGSRAGGGPAVVAGTMEIGLFQRSGNVEKVLRKPKVILELDLVEPEEGNTEQ